MDKTKPSNVSELREGVKLVLTMYFEGIFEIVKRLEKIDMKAKELQRKYGLSWEIGGINYTGRRIKKLRKRILKIMKEDPEICNLLYKILSEEYIASLIRKLEKLN